MLRLPCWMTKRRKSPCASPGCRPDGAHGGSPGGRRFSAPPINSPPATTPQTAVEQEVSDGEGIDSGGLVQSRPSLSLYGLSGGGGCADRECHWWVRVGTIW